MQGCSKASILDQLPLDNGKTGLSAGFSKSWSKNQPGFGQVHD
jgi:hypothetical protein